MILHAVPAALGAVLSSLIASPLAASAKTKISVAINVSTGLARIASKEFRQHNKVCIVVAGELRRGVKSKVRGEIGVDGKPLSFSFAFSFSFINRIEVRRRQREDHD